MSEGSRTPWEGSHNQLTWAQRGSQRLNGQKGSLHGTELGTLHICHSYAAWSTCGTPNSGNGCCLQLFLLVFGTLFLILGQLAQFIQGEVLNLKSVMFH